MMQIVLIGIGAGATSALLFASIASGSPLSFVLANFAQLPIMLAAIGWTHLTGLIGALIASAGLAVATTGSVAFAFLLGIGLPACWMGYLALLAHPSHSTRADGISAFRRNVARDRGRRHVPARSYWPGERRSCREPAACLRAARLRGDACADGPVRRPRLHAWRALFHGRAVRLADRVDVA